MEDHPEGGWLCNGSRYGHCQRRDLQRAGRNFHAQAGTPGSLITIKASPGERVVIDGGKKPLGFRMGASSSASTVSRSSTSPATASCQAGRLESDGSSLGVEIVNNTVHDCGNNPDTAAIYYAGGGSGGLIQGNHLYKRGRWDYFSRMVKILSRTVTGEQYGTCEHTCESCFGRLTAAGRRPMLKFLPLDQKHAQKLPTLALAG